MPLIKWKSYSPSFVSRRYNYLAPIYPLFEYIFLLPRNIRRRAVDALKLRNGSRVLEIGCGTGKNLSLLSTAAGIKGKVFGIDLSKNMLKRAIRLKEKTNLSNVELSQADAGTCYLPENLDGVLFSLSYATMTHRIDMLNKIWTKLKSGGRVVVMDAKYSNRLPGKLLSPFKPFITLFLKATVLGNPYVDAVSELREVAGNTLEVEEIQMNSYFIACAVKH